MRFDKFRKCIEFHFFLNACNIVGTIKPSESYFKGEKRKSPRKYSSKIALLFKLVQMKEGKMNKSNAHMCADDMNHKNVSLNGG